MRTSLLETLAAKGRISWLEEELAALANPDALRVAPEDAWKKIKGLPALDPAAPAARAGARGLARAPRRRTQPAARLDSRRCFLREIVVRLPRSSEALLALPEMQESVVRKCGEELLALVRDAGIGDPPPPLPRRERPDPAQLALVKRLADVAAKSPRSLEINSEVLATRRELEKLAAGKRDVSLLRGWRKDVVGEGS